MYSERRKRSRIPYRVGVRLKIAEGEIEGYTENISLTGALIKVCENKGKLSVNMPCMVVFEVPLEQARLEAEGTIVRIDGEKVGVRFTSLEPEVFWYLWNVLYYYLGDESRVDQELKEDAF